MAILLKNKESGTAWITSKVKTMLESRFYGQMPTELVFSTRQGEPKAFTSKLFFKVVQELNLNEGIADNRNKVVFHTLRHPFASWLAQEGVPLHTLAGLMGHKTTTMTQRYAHLSPEGLKAAAMLMEKM